MEIASFLSVYLNDSDNFYKFGAQLLSGARVEVMNIKQDKNTPQVDKKCLALIELWIKSVDGAKWQDLIPAASGSGFKGLATALTDELGGEPLQISVAPERDIRSLREGKYKRYLQ